VIPCFYELNVEHVGMIELQRSTSARSDGIVKLVCVDARAVEKIMSFLPFTSVTSLSNTCTLTASGVNPLGTV